MSAALFPHVDEMREFAVALPRDIGPMFGRDVVRLIDLAEAAQRVIDCYEAIEYGRPLRDFDEALHTYETAKKALGGTA